MQNQTHVEVTAAGQFTTAQGVMNGTHLVNQPAFPGNLHHGTGTMHGITMEQVDPSSLVEDDSDSEGDGLGSASPNPITGLKPGKKTKGRVKIKMEFIENKLRRYTTFSKRKTGIMKKAYELSTLTGTQVMLLVASETGHVYTFATRKLQPMITSESGKALIQTCLNSPDPPPGSQQQSVEQRMNPTGFEETELTYAVSEEESKLESAMKPVLAVANLPTQLSSTDSSSLLQQQTLSVPAGTLQVTSSTANTIPVSSFIQHQQQAQPTMINTNVSTPSPGKTTTTTNLQMQIPGLPPGALLVPPGTPLIPVQQNGQQITGQNTPTQQTLYRLSNSNQLVSISSTNDGTFTVSTNGNGQAQQTTTTTIQDNNQQQQQQQQQQQHTLQAVQTSVSSTPNLSVLSGGTNSSAAMTPGVVMYQTPQGIVYAPTTATLADRSIFNFQQPAAALSVQQPDAQGQQIITIPVPVSLAGTPMLQFATSPAETQVPVTLSQPSAAKKAKK